MHSVRCTALIKGKFYDDNFRCSRHAIDGKFCAVHNPVNARQRKLDAVQRRKAYAYAKYMCRTGLKDFWSQIAIAAMLTAYAAREERYLLKYQLGCSNPTPCMTHQIFGGWVPKSRGDI